MDPSHCDDELNQDYVLGILDPSEATRLDAHLRGCPACALRVKQYGALFQELADLPLPSVPVGIASGVLRRLQPSPSLRGGHGAFGFLIRRPAFAAATGGLLGLAIAVFREPILLLFGRMTSGLVADGTIQLITGIRQVLHDLSVLTIVVNPILRAFLNLEPVARAMGDAVRAMPAQASASSVLLSLATAILLARLLGQVRREKLGHAKS